MTPLMLNALLALIGLPLIVGTMTLIAWAQFPEILRRPQPPRPLDPRAGWAVATWA
ncbi:hypothetical protein [Actinoplanes aureus]|uniref:Uncharacterized protein n=1 Tax=Actinoplanes aureus TaxID=2792083 RepID=A0A931C780_9ACTN|nr:hypothetical protein [Actinoplanes aureus]MBG0560748.1 hypothetical protein [Actinoplanes aureus]